jgi:hypothetical protein
MTSKYLSIHRYIPNIEKDKAFGRRFPEYRGTWLPSLDVNYCVGSIAINWFGIRVRIGG